MPVKLNNEKQAVGRFECLLASILLCILLATSVEAQTFQAEETGIQTNFSSRYYWTDFDGDGDTDALEYGYEFGGTLHVRNGGSFVATTVAVPGQFMANDIGFELNDYDHDSDLDILFARYNDVAIAENDGNNIFSIHETNIQFNDNEYGPLFWVDVDGDLDLDVVHTGKIYLNTNQIYTESVYQIPVGIRKLIWGDINNDGLIDILSTFGYSEYTGNAVQVFLNQGDGNFQPGIEPGPTVHDNASLFLFDANNDGKLDIFASDDKRGKCVVLLNTMINGNLQFAAPYSLGTIAANVATSGDINNDGWADVVMGGYSYDDNEYQVMVFKNAGTGTLSFSKTNSFESTVTINALHLTDFDGDMDLDIHMKVFNQNLFQETSTMLINTGTVAVSPPATPGNLTATIGNHVSLGWIGQSNVAYNIEFKRDGKIIRVNPTTTAGKLLLTDNPFLISSGAFSVYNPPPGNYEWRVQSVNRARRTSAFSAAGAFQIGSPPTGLTLEVAGMTTVKLCWNFTGSAESFVVFRKSNNSAPEEIATLPGGTFCFTDASLQKNAYYEYYVKSVSSGAYSGPSQTVTYYSSQFVPVSFGTHEPNIVNASVHAADYDLDADYDLEFMGRILDHYGSDLNFRNDGTGNFPDLTSILPTLPYEFEFNKVVDALDMDNDGDTDFCVILGSDYGRQKLALLVNENGTLTLGFQTNPYLALYQAGVADFNNDGRRDILYRHAVGNGVGNPNVYELLIQEKDGNFTVNKFRFTDGDYGELGQFHIADLNNDGFQDICFTGTQYEPLRFFINRDGMTFVKEFPTLTSTPLAFLDVDGDGITDYVGSSDGGFRWYKGAANFQFSPKQIIHQTYSVNTWIVKMADINLDGLPDFVMSDGYRTSVAINKGNAVFESGSFQLDEHWESSFALTDMEGDGDLDVVKLGNDDQHQGYNFFYLNQADKLGATNARPSVPMSLSAAFSFGKLNISWQSSTDDKTPVNMLSYNLWITDSNGKATLHGETDASGFFRRRLAPGNAGYRTAYTIRDLPVGTYKIRVQAIDAAYASSAWSGEFLVSVEAGPTNLQVDRILLNKIKLSWTGSTFGEQKVIAERKTPESEYEVLTELPAGTLSFIDENLEYNKRYQYRIIEVSNSTTTAPSNDIEWSTLMWVLKDTNLPNMWGSLDIADYTQDGKMDILINGARSITDHSAEITKAVFENTPAGWVRDDITPSTLPTTASLKFFDINADHKLDLYQHGYGWDDPAFKTEIFMNNGDKTFTPVTNEFTQHAYEIRSAYDDDMDNDLDLMVTDHTISSNYLPQFLRNNGAGDYTTDYIPCNICYVVASADFDGDGDEDFIRSENGSYSLYLYTPGGPHSSGITFSAYDNQVAVTDYNGDGLPDIILLTGSYYTQGKIYKNLGLKNGMLEFEKVLDDLPSGNNTFPAADFDHDGHMDMAVISPGATIYRNTGHGTFDKYQLPYYTFSLHHSGIVDFDNDGDLDIYLSGYITYQYTSGERPLSMVLVNQIIDANTGPVNAAPAIPHNLSAAQDSLGMHLAWTDGADDKTAQTGLTHDIVLFRGGKAILKAPIDPVTGTRRRLEAGRFAGKAIVNNLRAGSYTWKVQAVDQSYRGSEFSIEGTFIFLPPPPLINDTLIYKCGRVVTLTAKGNSIQWYSDKERAHLIAAGSFHPNESQVVYVTQKIDGYEGIARRVAITIYETPPPPATTSLVEYCEYTSGNFYLTAAGQDIQWYSDANKNQLLARQSYLIVGATDNTYYATQTLSGCESQPITVTVRKNVIDTNVRHINDRLEVAEEHGSNYAWYKNGFYIFNSNSRSIPYHGETGAYGVMVTKGYCSESSDIYHLPEDLVTGIEDQTTGWSVYPNPSTGHFTIDLGIHRGTVSIYDITGRLVFTAVAYPTHETGEIQLTHVPPGVYLAIFNEGNNTSQKRVVVY